METKKCYSCKMDKDLSCFYPSHLKSHRYLCRECIQKYKIENRDKLLLQSRNKYKRDTRIWLIHSAKKRAKEKGFVFDICKDDIVIPEVCPVLGIPLFSGNGKQCPNSPSIDRIDNNKGYTKDNIMVISWRANDLKRNATVEELKKILAYMESVSDTPAAAIRPA